MDGGHRQAHVSPPINAHKLLSLTTHHLNIIISNRHRQHRYLPILKSIHAMHYFWIVTQLLAGSVVKFAFCANVITTLDQENQEGKQTRALRENIKSSLDLPLINAHRSKK